MSDDRKSMSHLLPTYAQATGGKTLDPTWLKPGDEIDTAVLAAGHVLHHTGKLVRKSTHILGGWVDVTGYLFTNCFVIATAKEKGNILKFYVDQRPIRLELLEPGDFQEDIVKRNRFAFRKSWDGKADDTPSTEGALYPFTLESAARGVGQLRFYAESDAVRLGWEEKFDAALRLLQAAPQIFYLKDEGGDVLASTTPVGAPPSEAWGDATPTCTAQLVSSTGVELLAVGRTTGVWFGDPNDSSKQAFKRVLHLKMVTQCAFLPEHEMFLVLADKSLYACDVNVLVPSSTSPVINSVSPALERLSGMEDILFFSVGRNEDRTFVVEMRKKGDDSVFRLLEPVTGRRTGIPVKLDKDGNPRKWFRVHREFSIPETVYGVLFLSAKLALLCKDKAEIMDLTDHKSVSIPQSGDQLSRLLKKRPKCRLLQCVRVDKETYLLCYEDFGLYVDKHGGLPYENNIIDWEGKAQHVAVHYPYVILFDARFIEIRHREDGRLVQIIRSEQVRGLVTTPVLVGRLKPEEAAFAIWAKSGVYATVVDEDDELDAKVLRRRFVEVVPVNPDDEYDGYGSRTQMY